MASSELGRSSPASPTRSIGDARLAQCALEEIRDIESKGIDPSTIVISDRAHVVMPYHAEFDRLEEI